MGIVLRFPVFGKFETVKAMVLYPNFVFSAKI